MSLFSLNQFRRAVTQYAGLSRGFLFKCTISPNAFFSVLGIDQSIWYFCRSTQLPAYTIESVPVSCMTMSSFLPGKRTYEPITLSFYNTNRQVLRSAFIDWQNGLRDLTDGVQALDVPVGGVGLSYTSTIILQHYAEDQSILAEYQLLDAFPTSIGGLSFSQDSDAEFQAFDVSFAYRNMTYTAF